MDAMGSDQIDLDPMMHMLTMHRDAQMVGPWLRLSSRVEGVSERDFWRAPETQRRILVSYAGAPMR